MHGNTVFRPPSSSPYAFLLDTGVNSGYDKDEVDIEKAAC